MKIRLLEPFNISGLFDDFEVADVFKNKQKIYENSKYPVIDIPNYKIKNVENTKYSSIAGTIRSAGILKEGYYIIPVFDADKFYFFVLTTKRKGSDKDIQFSNNITVLSFDVERKNKSEIVVKLNDQTKVESAIKRLDLNKENVFLSGYKISTENRTKYSIKIKDKQIKDHDVKQLLKAYVLTSSVSNSDKDALENFIKNFLMIKSDEKQGKNVFYSFSEDKSKLSLIKEKNEEIVQITLNVSNVEALNLDEMLNAFEKNEYNKFLNLIENFVFYPSLNSEESRKRMSNLIDKLKILSIYSFQQKVDDKKMNLDIGKTYLYLLRQEEIADFSPSEFFNEKIKIYDEISIC